MVPYLQHKEREDMNSTIERNVSDETAPNQTTVKERLEKNKDKIPILPDRETVLTKINPRMCWEQIAVRVQ